MSKEIHATMVDGQWVVALKSDPGKPITPREFAQFERSLTLKTRTYYINERKVSVVAAKKREQDEQVKAEAQAKAAEAANLGRKLTTTV